MTTLMSFLGKRLPLVRLYAPTRGYRLDPFSIRDGRTSVVPRIWGHQEQEDQRLEQLNLLR